VNVTKTHFIISVVLAGTLFEPVWASESWPTIEVFTDSRFEVINGTDNATVYVIDRIEQLQQALSMGLPSKPETAKTLVMQRFQGMNSQLSSEMENAAKGLVQALHYGIDRYPAILFDGKVVVYGVTDINAATRIYQQWQGEGKR
jgi:integrating conjugative element protein (TIGR03757 family)